MTFAEKIWKMVCSFDPGKMTDEERAVMSQLGKAYKENRHITQLDIAKSQRWLGCHPEHEKDIWSNEFETTTRQVRQTIFDLRHKYQMPIVSDNTGYYIPVSEEEARTYIVSLENMVKAQTKSLFSTYNVMKQALNMQSNFFENLV